MANINDYLQWRGELTGHQGEGNKEMQSEWD